MAKCNLEIVSFNAPGLGSERKRKKIFNILKKQTSLNSVIFLQETQSTKKVEKLWEYQWRHKIFHSHGTSNSRGVCIALRAGLDDHGRYLILHIEIQKVHYVFINFFAPNDQQSQVTTMKEIVEKLKNISADKATSYIWGGDWNCVLNKSLDALGGGVPSLKKKSVGQIKALMTDFDLIDIWIVRNPTYREFAWRRSKPVTSRRLDYFLVSSHMKLDIASCGFYTQIQSDHSPIFLKISPLADAFMGPEYWKFNNSLVSDPIYIEKTREPISEIRTNSFDFDDIRVKWEFLKFKILQFTQSYSKTKATRTKAKRLNLEKKVEMLERKFQKAQIQKF